MELKLRRKSSAGAPDLGIFLMCMNLSLSGNKAMEDHFLLHISYGLGLQLVQD